MEEQIKELQKVCNKLDIYRYKYYCISNEFKNLTKKLSDFNTFKNLKLSFVLDEIEDNILLFTVLANGHNKKLKDCANLKSIDVFENKDINFFIKFYKITNEFEVEI
jgi:hypothetical protein